MFQSPSNRVKCSDQCATSRSVGSYRRFQSPSNRVKCSDAQVARCKFRCTSSFNPLAIGSNVLISGKKGKREDGGGFQSPSNRVKCSDQREKNIVAIEKTGFQSPSNRVKCSDIRFPRSAINCRVSFNPLAIGSNVLMPRSCTRTLATLCVSIP